MNITQKLRLRMLFTCSLFLLGLLMPVNGTISLVQKMAEVQVKQYVERYHSVKHPGWFGDHETIEKINNELANAKFITPKAVKKAYWLKYDEQIDATAIADLTTTDLNDLANNGNIPQFDFTNAEMTKEAVAKSMIAKMNAKRFSNKFNGLVRVWHKDAKVAQAYPWFTSLPMSLQESLKTEFNKTMRNIKWNFELQTEVEAMNRIESNRLAIIKQQEDAEAARLAQREKARKKATEAKQAADAKKAEDNRIAAEAKHNADEAKRLERERLAAEEEAADQKRIAANREKFKQMVAQSKAEVAKLAAKDKAADEAKASEAKRVSDAKAAIMAAIIKPLVDLPVAANLQAVREAFLTMGTMLSSPESFQKVGDAVIAPELTEKQKVELLIELMSAINKAANEKKLNNDYAKFALSLNAMSIINAIKAKLPMTTKLKEHLSRNKKKYRIGSALAAAIAIEYLYFGGAHVSSAWANVWLASAAPTTVCPAEGFPAVGYPTVCSAPLSYGQVAYAPENAICNSGN